MRIVSLMCEAPSAVHLTGQVDSGLRGQAHTA